MKVHVVQDILSLGQDGQYLVVVILGEVQMLVGHELPAIVIESVKCLQVDASLGPDSHLLSCALFVLGYDLSFYFVTSLNFIQKSTFPFLFFVLVAKFL